ncbi:hypothetical protein [Fusibacter tunisiensis]|uniref:Uncharacterized protein n=1 Tax=Fusibacter tunisiensis TaxID=1008308 RepID=A0ABS2MU14_9FIRM|nr:hypothetical protein [Fusibacter tunisiensis]MBM7562872.1 hypothetical protein [Fusibacter tunisiensis]
MDFGLYEKLLDSELKNQISELHNRTRKVYLSTEKWAKNPI